MLYPRDFEQKAIDRQQAAHDDMVAWLSNQPPAVWLWFARRGNWDTCVPVFIWMVEQPTCDAAVVASLFWEAGPAYIAQETVARSEDLGESDYFELIRTILLTWRNRPPCDEHLKLLNAQAAAAYRVMVTSAWDGIDPLEVPDWLFGPFGSREEEYPVEHIIDDDALRDVFLELGMWHGSAPPDQTRVTGTSGDLFCTTFALEPSCERRARIITGLALVSLSVLMLYILRDWWLVI